MRSMSCFGVAVPNFFWKACSISQQAAKGAGLPWERWALPAGRAQRAPPIGRRLATCPTIEIRTYPDLAGFAREPGRYTARAAARSSSALNSQPMRAMMARKYIHTRSAMPAPMDPYITL
jgi:hypothetical protein